MTKNDLPAACAAFAESQRLDPALGTLLNLAVCHERQGRPASAWVEFRQAASEARRRGQTTRAEYADQKAATLEPQMPRLSLVFEPDTAALSDLLVTLDESTLGRAAWSNAIPVDPGAHHLVVAAPGHQPWQTDLQLPEGQQQTIHIPLLLPNAAPAAPPQPTASPQQRQPAPAPKDGLRPQQWVGISLTGAGAVSLGVATYFGLSALSHKSKRDQNCNSSNVCSQEGVTQDSLARDAATGANIAGALGIALAGAGISVLLLSSSSSSADQETIRASFGADRASTDVWLSGTF